MKKSIIFFSLSFFALTSCDKWTETESKAQDFEAAALDNLKEVRDQYKWTRESEIVEESKIALEEYWKDLTEYKKRAWVNTNNRATQSPMYYFWFDGTMWRAEDGLPKTWLQSIPDSVTAISLWGGKGIRPKDLTPNMKKDLEIFQKKGSVVLTCYQVSGVGAGLPGSPDGTLNQWMYFREKYPCTDYLNQWPEIYARELARHLIALGLDGFDIDWEPTCGDHGRDPNPCGGNFVHGEFGKQMDNFIKEIAKYFGPVGDAFYVKTQQERENNIKALFDASTTGYHPNEKIFIDEFKPYLPENWLTKRYYLCADVPCGGSYSTIFSGRNTFELYFDKHFVQDYDNNGISSGRFIPSGKPEYNSTGAEFEKAKNGQVQYWRNVLGKVNAIKERRTWGFAAYHGQIDFDNSHDFAEFHNTFGAAVKNRKYKNYAFTREVIRMTDPRPIYKGTKEVEPTIIKP